MASRNFHKNRTKERKARQADERYLESLRLRALQFEHVTPRSASRMSREELERTVKRGKRKHFNPFVGHILATEAARQMLRNL